MVQTEYLIISAVKYNIKVHKKEYTVNIHTYIHTYLTYTTYSIIILFQTYCMGLK